MEVANNPVIKLTPTTVQPLTQSGQSALVKGCAILLENQGDTEAMIDGWWLPIGRSLELAGSDDFSIITWNVSVNFYAADSTPYPGGTLTPASTGYIQIIMMKPDIQGYSYYNR